MLEKKLKDLNEEAQQMKLEQEKREKGERDEHERHIYLETVKEQKRIELRAKYHSLLNEIDKQLTEPEGVGKWDTVAICNEIKEKFRKDTIIMFEALSEVTGVQQQICLTILKLIFPNCSQSIWSISD